jgi:preprotein translocase subunit SecG
MYVLGAIMFLISLLMYLIMFKSKKKIDNQIQTSQNY